MAQREGIINVAASSRPFCWRSLETADERGVGTHGYGRTLLHVPCRGARRAFCSRHRGTVRGSTDGGLDGYARASGHNQGWRAGAHLRYGLKGSEGVGRRLRWHRAPCLECSRCRMGCTLVAAQLAWLPFCWATEHTRVMVCRRRRRTQSDGGGRQEWAPALCVTRVQAQRLESRLGAVCSLGPSQCTLRRTLRDGLE